MKLSYKTYKELSYKGTPQVYFDYFYRHISHPVSFVFLRLGLTPTMISVASIVLGLLAGAVMVFGNPIHGLLIFMASYLLDFCDGNMARVIIKSTGMSDVAQRRGMLIENVNTNVGLFAMYIGLGATLSAYIGADWPMLLAFTTFGIKMIGRYGVRQAFDTFKAYLPQTKPGAKMMKQYRASLKSKLYFLLRKCLFSANFYYVVYMGLFLLGGEVLVYGFLAYALADAAMIFLRLMKAFVASYGYDK